MHWNTLNKQTNNDLRILNENATKEDTTPVLKYIENGYHLKSKHRQPLSPPSAPVPMTEIQRYTMKKMSNGVIDKHGLAIYSRVELRLY